MSDNISEKFFNEFEPAFKKVWKDLVIKDLKNKEEYEKLNWKIEELDIEPFYTKEDLEQIKTKDFFKQGNTKNSSNWTYLESIKTTNPRVANKTALNALVTGADGIIFDLDDPTSHTSEIIKFLLAGILPQHCTIGFKTRYSPEKLLNHYLKCIDSSGLNIEALSGFLDYDPIAEWTLHKDGKDLNFQEIKETLNLTTQTPQFSGLTISGEVFLNSGASAVQQIALFICVLTEYLEELSRLGIPPSSLFKNIIFKLPVGKNFFIEIAKLRALHLFIYKLAHLYGVKEFKPSDVQIHATTAWWTKSAIEPHLNILRNTTEAMAAILGGCQSLSILPHDISQQDPDNFSRRISRNISNILKEEAFLNKVSNPADGSYYLEKLTEIIIVNSWSLVQDIESKGGFIKAFKSGYIMGLVKNNYDFQLENSVKVNDKIVGVNYFKNQGSVITSGFNSNQSGWFEFDRLSAAVENLNNKQRI
ncbi:hypothetical protein BH23BAC1_BH23BAC1_44880 [soil metagenome]